MRTQNFDDNHSVFNLNLETLIQSEELKDLLRKMFAYDPNERIQIQDIANHSFFSYKGSIYRKNSMFLF